jgi:hypothetical protein
MNNIEEVIKREVDTLDFLFDPSTFHAWIRFFEYFLNMTYRLDIKWQIRTEYTETVKETRKKEIKKERRKEDCPRDIQDWHGINCG